MNIYLAGPMRGYLQFNFPAFKFAAAKLRAEGHEVFSPAEKGEEAELETNPGLQDDLAFRRKVFKLDLAYICDHADCVALLPGWRYSTGAVAEHALAIALGISVRNLVGKEYVHDASN